MTLPRPKIGMVIRYAYLWHDESLTGEEDAQKSRPCVVLKAFSDEQMTRVFVVPITRTQPKNPLHAVELPDLVKKYLGLSPERQWIICSDVNEFDWVGPDISIVPKKEPKTCQYGMLPPKLFLKVRDRVVYLAQGKILKTVARTE